MRYQTPATERAPFLPDLLVGLAILLVAWSVMTLAGTMTAPFDPTDQIRIDLSPSQIPYYAARSVLRMFIAFAASLLFTFVYAYIAYNFRPLRAVMLSIIDILQSVPVLGFLSVTVTGFIALFPHSILGVECASIFAIFTAMVWNMVFGFYQSLTAIPGELREVARVNQRGRWWTFKHLELPSGMINLIWNSMMSFGGAWFFLAQSEAITVLNHNIQLPGLGSYMAQAVDTGDTRAALLAVLAMVTVIVALDQLLWRPLVAWSEKFKLEQTESVVTSKSWALALYQSSHAGVWFKEAFSWIADVFRAVFAPVGRVTAAAGTSPLVRSKRLRPFWLLCGGVLGAFALLWVAQRIFVESEEILKSLGWEEMKHVVWMGCLTLGRVAIMTIFATLIWTPIGVWIGFRPKVATFLQPIIQILASFPVNMTFPFVVGWFVAWHIGIDWGSILLIALGTQWYILFNVIAGALAVPTDLKEAAATYGIRGWRLWKRLIIPAIFPAWVTGACTATGGAWNATIVAEMPQWGKTVLKAEGLGAYIAQVTAAGDWPGIIFGIVVMSSFVVLINKTVWRPLYHLAETRYKLE